MNELLYARELGIHSPLHLIQAETNRQFLNLSLWKESEEIHSGGVQCLSLSHDGQLYI